MLLIARIIATVNPYSSYSSGLWSDISGIIPKYALPNIVMFYSFLYSYGVGN